MVEYPELAAAWGRAHSAMHNSSAVGFDEARSFHDAVKVALGERSVDSG